MSYDISDDERGMREQIDFENAERKRLKETPPLEGKVYEHFYLNEHNVLETCALMSEEQVDKILGIKGTTSVTMGSRLLINVEGDLHIFQKVS